MCLSSDPFELSANRLMFDELFNEGLQPRVCTQNFLQLLLYALSVSRGGQAIGKFYHLPFLIFDQRFRFRAHPGARLEFSS